MQGHTNVILTTADPLETEVTTRAGDEERELNQEDLWFGEHKLYQNLVTDVTKFSQKQGNVVLE